MQRESNISRDLERAYVQCQVIEASLQHLSATLAGADPALRRDLSSYAVRFDDYVRRLRERRDHEVRLAS